MPNTYTYEEIGARAKSRNPEALGKFSDFDIGKRMAERNPEIAAMVSGTTQQVQKPQESAKPQMSKGIVGFGKTLGTAIGASGASKSIGEANIAEAESNFQLAKLLNKPGTTEEQKARIRLQLGGKPIIPEAQQQIPELTKTGKDVSGEALGTLGWAAAGAAAPATLTGRLALGTALGAGTGAKGALERGEGAGGIVKSTAKGAVAGLAVSGALEGIGYGIRQIAKSSLGQKTVGRIYNRELQPPTKEVAQDIEKGFRTFGEEAANIVDDAGKPIYVGTYNTLKEKAKNQIVQKGSRLMKEAKGIDALVPKTSRKDIYKEVLNEVQDTLGGLSASEMKKVSFEMGRMNQALSVTDKIEAKRLYDSLIPDSAWLHAGDANTSFISQVRYAYRDALRRSIDADAAKVGNTAIESLNKELGIAMDMKKLASTQLAKRQVEKLPWFKWLQRIVDDTVLNPAISTRAAQGIRTAGMQPGKLAPVRKAATIGLSSLVSGE